MIRLDCPQCQRSLEIDDGFAGGVCRCFNCGTLMTVPAAGEHAERLTLGSGTDRPDRPDAPGTPGKSSVPRRDEPDVFVTSTGRTVRLTHDQVSRIAVARKPRMGLRIMLIAGFAVIAVAMFVVMAVLGIQSLDQQQLEQQAIQQKQERGVDLSQQVLSYSPDANPLLLTTPNLFGMPVKNEKQTLVLLIDSSAAMHDYLDFAIGVISANLKTLPADVSVQIIFADETGLHFMPNTPIPFDKWNPAELAELLATLRPLGVQNLPAGLDKALAAKPDRIVLVTSMAPVKPVMDKLDAALAAAPNVICDINQLGRTSDALQQLAESRKGAYLNLPDGQIQSWYAEYQRQH
ncbi:MAG: vWA domain-containing protein [Phycisphaerales bacterium]